MILAHGEHAAARQIAFEIGVAAALRRFDPARRAVRLDHPNAAIGALAENHDACRDRISAAAIFMDAAPHIERRRCQLFDLGIRPAAAQNRAAAFAGPRFEPIEIMPIDAQAAKTDRRAGHEIDAHRRDPGAIRGNGLGHPRGRRLLRELESRSD